MPWRPLPRIAFAVAVYPFQPSAPADLPLELGDELYIIEEGGFNNAWLRGYLVAPPSLLAGLTSVKGQTLEARVFSGIFPRTCVEIREWLGEADVDSSAVLDSPPPSAKRVSSGLRHNETPDHDHQQVNGDLETSAVSPSALISRSSSFRKSLGPAIPIHNLAAASKRRSSSAPKPPAPVPLLKIGDESPTSATEPLIDEIASCLREWHSTNLHELLLSRWYGQLDQLSALVNRLDLARRQLLYGVLTEQELTVLRERTVWDLVRGNKMLQNDIVVRDPHHRGRLLTDRDDAVAVSRLQASMSLSDHAPATTTDKVNLFHLLFELQTAKSTLRDSVTLLVCLYAQREGEPPQPLTEAFSIDVPPHDALSKSLSTANLRTLFFDLSATDVGQVTSSNTRLFLVIKARTSRLTQPASLMARRPAPSRTETNAKRREASGESVTHPNLHMKGNRRSFVWTPSRSGGSLRQRNLPATTSEQEPTTSEETLADNEDSHEDSQAASNPTGPQVVKKDSCVAVLDVKQLLADSAQTTHSVTLWCPAETSTEAAEIDHEWDRYLSSVMTSPTGRYKKARLFDRLDIRLRSFKDPDVDHLVRTTPTMLHGVSRTPKMGFSGAPHRTRSDIYITLLQPVLPGQALLSHPERGAVALQDAQSMQNLQLTLEVRRSTGARVENCIYPASNSVGLTAWRTTASPHGGVWGQTIRLSIPSEHVPDCHLIMSLADAPSFPFALCWMPLWKHGAFVSDGVHAPVLYLYDPVTSTVQDGRGAYMDLPWDSRGKDSVSRESWSEHMAHLRLESYLCSTVFSQDQVLLGILKWQEQTDDELLILLRQLPFVPENEIVKLLSDVLDSLFSILVDRSGNDEFEDMIFGALVTILSIVHDRRFNLGPLLQEYIAVRFNYPFATPSLIRSFLRLISRPADYQNSRQLRAAFKVGRELMRFIATARLQQKAKEAGIGITSTGFVFARDLRKIFEALEDQMRDQSPALVGSKTLIVQNVHTWLPELELCFSAEETLALAVSFVNACSDVTGKLVLHKLVLIYHLLDHFKALEAQPLQSFQDRILLWLAPCWGTTEQPDVQWHDQIRLCCSVITLLGGNYSVHLPEIYLKILHSFQSMQKASLPQDNSFSPLFSTSYPFPTKPVSGPRSHREILVELAALKATFSPQQLFAHAAQLGDMEDFLALELEVDTAILRGVAFPASWLTLTVYHQKHLLHMLDGMTRLMSDTLIPAPENADGFNTRVWKSLQIAVLDLVRSESLALETLPEQKRRAVWKIAGDIREQGAELLGRIWDVLGWDTDAIEKQQFGLNRLGGFQVQYVPSLVGPVVELCLSVHEGLRSVAVEILQSMIISEWGLNEDLIEVQAEIIASLVGLFQARNVGESAQQRLFVGHLIDLFAPLSQSTDSGLWDATTQLVATIEQLLDLLIDVHSPGQNESLRLMNTLKLMDYLRDMDKVDMYISYIHQLANTEAQSRNFREAGLALGLHADLYAWDPYQTVDELHSPALPRQSAFERKESLYFAMITFFEEGAAWESALSCYRELAEQYEQETFDFAKLARTQRAVARIYDVIARGESHPSRFFRVAFGGLGFPAHLRGKQFIYEGSASDRVGSFMERLQRQHPEAIITAHGTHEDAEGQFLHVTALSVYRRLDHPMYQRHRVPSTTKEFLCHISPRQFCITSRRHSPRGGLKEQWVEKTVYSTEETFPTILRRSPIVSEEVISLSPLETAVERTIRKTAELSVLQQRVKSGDASGEQSILEAVRTSIDPNNQSSIAQYREALPKFDRHALDLAEDVAKLSPLETALQTALLDFTSELRQCLALLTTRISADEREQVQEQFASTFAPELAVLAPAAIPAGGLAFDALDAEGLFPVNTPRTATVNGDEPHGEDAMHRLGDAGGEAATAIPSSKRGRLTSLLRRNTKPNNNNKEEPTTNGVGSGKHMRGLPENSIAVPPVEDDNSSIQSSQAGLRNGQSHGISTERVSSATRMAEGQDAALSSETANGHERERPFTAQSGASALTSTTNTPTMRKSGSIRKRLSNLSMGIGRRPSHGALAFGPQATVVEE